MKLSNIVGHSKMAMITHSPTILTAVGVVGVVGTVVLASRATLKIGTVLDEHKDKMDQINQGIALETDEYTADDAKKDKTTTYVQTSLGLVKLYLPAAIVGIASVAALLGANGIIRQRSAALATALAGTERVFSAYRERVKEDAGYAKDYEYMHGEKMNEVEREKKTIEVTNPETGETETAEVNVIQPQPQFTYERWFAYGFTNMWHHVPEYNIVTLKHVQNMANERLQRNGRLLLNEVYEMLGFEPSKAGCVVGWTTDGPDGYVDFGLSDLVDQGCFTEHYNEAVLDFNVQGSIWDKYPETIKQSVTKLNTLKFEEDT